MNSDTKYATEAVYDFRDRPADELAKALHDSDDVHDDPGVPATGETPSALAATRWRVAKSLLKLRDQINARFPDRNKASDGTIGDDAHCPGTSDHCPKIVDDGIGVVAAIDITHDPAHGLDAGVVANALRVSRDPRIKYIISNRRIASSYPAEGKPPFEWRDYNGSNPHRAHFHVSVLAEKTGPGGYDTITDWTAV